MAGVGPSLEDIGYDLNASAIDADKVEADIPGVTSRLGTPVDRFGHLKDATILGLNMPYSETLLAQLAQHSPEVVRDLMRGRTYMAGEGLLGQGDSGLRQISMMGNEAGDTINLGQKMGETYDDFLERTLSNVETSSAYRKSKVALADLISDEALKTLEINKPDRDKVRSLVVEDIYDKILPETPAGTTDIFNAETGKWEVVDSRSALEKQLDRAKAQERVIADTRKYDPSGLGPQKVGWIHQQD